MTFYMKESTKDNIKFSIFLVSLITGFAVLIISFFNVMQYDSFNDTEEYSFSFISYEQSVVSVDYLLKHPDFQWVGRNYGSALSKGYSDGAFSEYFLEVQGTRAKFKSYWDYAKYRKYIKNKFREYESGAYRDWPIKG